MRRAAFLLTALALSACAADEPAPVLAACSDRTASAAPSIPTLAADFGCTNAINLRLMVADPRDLERGAQASAPSGDAAIAAVRRHRAGEVKPLPGVPTDGGVN